ncbi:MAG: hypothetical protein VX617_06130 [Pseudomonadota bacterium]|nr:hypothetical protein [Pseudomonadota bacterium]
MPLYGMFAAPILGMLGQVHNFGSISQNASNMNTGGYKGQNTVFSTIFENTGGLTAESRNFIEKQGRIATTNNYLDVAIRGTGLFVLNSKVDGTGKT